MKPTRKLTVWIYVQAFMTVLNVTFAVLTGDWKSWAVAALCAGCGLAAFAARRRVRAVNEQRRVLIDHGLDPDRIKRLRDHYDNTDTSTDMENGVWES